MKIILTLTFAYFLLLTSVATWCDPQACARLFSEQGFFEQFSIIAWIAAGLALLFRHRASSPHLAWSMTLLCFLCAAREDDWHKKFTTDGILKLKYYTKSVAPLSEKIPAALIASVFLLLIGYATVIAYRALRSGLWRASTSVQLSLFGIALFFVGKVFDRSISLIDEFFHIKVPYSIGHYIGAYEEGFEMWSPLLFTVAALWPHSVTHRSSIP